MPKVKIEICHIRQMSEMRDGGFLGLVSICTTYFSAYIGKEIIAESSTFKFKSSEYSSQSRGKGEDRIARGIEAVYQEVVQKLVSEGWEPAGTDEKGRIMTFQKRSASSKTDDGDIVASLERLGRMRSQGFLSDKEFELAKKRLLE